MNCTPWSSHEAGRARPVRRRRCGGPACRPTPRASSSSRRASCSPARSWRWRAGPASRPVSPCSTCAAASPGPDGSSRGSSVARIWAWISAPAPSTSHVSAPATFPVASRSRGSPRSRPARSTWCSCSRPCSRFPTRSRCCRRSRGRSRAAGASPSRWRRACPSRRPSERACPTPTRSGSRRCRRCSPAWSGPGWSSAGRLTAVAPTVRWRIR